jgi:rhamnogalacturonyl hydrolase YesR
MVGLSLGKIKEAVRAASFLQTLLETQPNFQEEFFYYCRPGNGLVTEKPAEEPDVRFIRISLNDKEENFYYILGAVIAFLAKLYTVTRERNHLELAEKYYQFIERAGSRPLRTESCGKLCYAATHLYQATGRTAYLKAAEKFMKSLLEIGEPGGGWIRNGNPTASSTAEFCVWRYSLLWTAYKDAKT